MRNITSKLKFCIVPLLLLGCQGQDSKKDGDPQQPVSPNPPGQPDGNIVDLVGHTGIEDGLNPLRAQRAAITITSETDPRLAITDVERCRPLVDLLAQLKPDWKLENYYSQLSEKQSSWALKSDQVGRYYRAYPSTLDTIEFVVEYKGEATSINCAIPRNWTMTVYRDADVTAPEVLKKYSAPSALDPTQLGEGSRGGFGFSQFFALGYQPLMSWSLKAQDVTIEDARQWLKEQMPAASFSDLKLDLKDLIDRQTVSPLEIISFSKGNTLNFQKLFIKPRHWINPTDPKNTIFGTYQDLGGYDLTIAEPAESLKINGKPGFESYVMLDAISLKPVACDKEGTMSDPNSCKFKNRAEVYASFDHLFGTKPANSCALAYYKAAKEVGGGVVKLLCVDQDGDLTLHHNELAKTINDSLNALNQKPVPASQKALL